MIKGYLADLTPRPTSIEQRAELLEATKWLQDMSWDHIKRLARFIEVYDIPQNVELFSEGDRASFMGIIEQGEVVVRKNSLHQSSQLIAKLGRGKTFGEMSLVDGSPRSASVRTKTQVVLMVLFQDKFEIMLKDVPTLGVQMLSKITQLISANLRRTSALLIDSLEHHE
ncbi:MAG: hypothetical protein COW84_06485 [Gammaproteobacteria bacterium CG22_combo_CG10-13_8_21_14_all_40_8]|nr:MAG: hypothetical protein COW84_06485 [Gammaproteobacteria bacterium CG22_combo_CG10-13_8_21_14_all_40_8]